MVPILKLWNSQESASSGDHERMHNMTHSLILLSLAKQPRSVVSYEEQFSVIY